MNNQNIAAYAENLDDWVKARNFAHEQNQFSLSQLKCLFADRANKPGLKHCYKVVGKTGYVNRRLFGLWMAGLLPEQQEG